MDEEEEDDAAAMEFERDRPATAMIRKKHIDITALGVVAGIKEVIHRNSIFSIPRADINPRFRRECRPIVFHSSWVKTSSCSSDYTPILIRNTHGDDFRMRSVGVTAGSGPNITVFDMELGKLLYEIEEHSSVVYSVMISRPAPHLSIMPVIVTGSHHGYMKSWDLQSGNFIRTFGVRSRGAGETESSAKKQDLKIHKGPVKVVYVHDNMKSLVFSGSANELLVWKLEEGALLKVLTDHTRPVSAICCYEFSDIVSNDKHPASVVSGGEDSCIMVYCLKDFSVRHVMNNLDVGPINDIKIPLVALNGSKEQLPVVIAACFDGSVQMWCLGSGTWLSAVSFPHGPVNSLCILPTPIPGLVTGHGDGSILITSLKTHEVLCSLSKKNAQTQTSSSFGPKGGVSLGLPTSVTTVSYTMSPRPMVLGGYQDPQVYVWDLNVGQQDSEEAALLKDILVVDLLWKDPLLPHHSDSEEEEEEEQQRVRGQKDHSKSKSKSKSKERDEVAPPTGSQGAGEGESRSSRNKKGRERKKQGTKSKSRNKSSHA